jgi:uracil-DNA glycosylase family 4
MNERQASWEDLKRQATERLGANAVFGEGPIGATVAIVGEAPGEQEDRAGKPFVGRAGKLLNELLEEAGIDRSEVYVTNIVKVRPTTEKDGRVKNRPPRVGEVGEGVEILVPELRAIGPDVLVLLGNTPSKALIDKSFAMKKDRGVLRESILDLPAIATYHPAYLLRLQGTPAYDEARDESIGDLKAARDAAKG